MDSTSSASSGAGSPVDRAVNLTTWDAQVQSWESRQGGQPGSLTASGGAEVLHEHRGAPMIVRRADGAVYLFRRGAHGGCMQRVAGVTPRQS